MIWVTGTNSVRRQDFSRNVGLGSSSQDLLGDDKISLETSISVAGLKNRSSNWERSMNLGDLWNVWKKNCRVN